MQLSERWPQVLRVLHDAKRASRHYAIATVSPEGLPHVTPIGHAWANWVSITTKGVRGWAAA